MYFVAARKYQDDEAAAPYMLGRTHYAATRKHQKRMTEIKINAGEEGNPYDYEEAERNWIDWYVGYHHARRDAGDLLTEDTV